MTCIRLGRHRTPLGGVVETNWPWTRPASTRPLRSLPPQTHSALPPDVGVETQPIFFPCPSPAPTTHRQSFPTSKLHFLSRWVLALGSRAIGSSPRGCYLGDGVKTPGTTPHWPGLQPGPQRDRHLTTAGCSSAMLPASLRSILRQCILPTYMKKIVRHSSSGDCMWQLPWPWTGGLFCRPAAI